MNLSNLEASETHDGSIDYDSEAGMSEECASRIDTESPTVHTESTTDAILSTWMAKEGNFAALDTTGERIKLSYNETLAIVGQYKIKVLHGVVSIYGAILTPKSPQETVLAPSTELLPSIRCVSGDWAEIELSSVSEDEDLENLERVNPTFGGIWKCQCSKCSVHTSRQSYSKVASL